MAGFLAAWVLVVDLLLDVVLLCAGAFFMLESPDAIGAVEDGAEAERKRRS